MGATHGNPAAGDDGIRQKFSTQSGPGSNGQTDDDGQVLLLSLLRIATLGAKLIAVDLDSIGIALKRRMISLEGAIAWLDDLDCDTCGGTPCIRPSFCKLCREADQRIRQARQSTPETVRKELKLVGLPEFAR
jgi:hypothetical protein